MEGQLLKAVTKGGVVVQWHVRYFRVKDEGPYGKKKLLEWSETPSFTGVKFLHWDSEATWCYAEVAQGDPPVLTISSGHTTLKLTSTDHSTFQRWAVYFDAKTSGGRGAKDPAGWMGKMLLSACMGMPSELKRALGTDVKPGVRALPGVPASVLASSMPPAADAGRRDDRKRTFDPPGRSTYGTDAKEFESLFAAFKFMDRKEAKLISDPKLFAEVTRRLCPDHKAHSWNEIDTDGNGCVSLPEFVDWSRANGIDLPIGIAGVQTMQDGLKTLPAGWTGPRDDKRHKAFVEASNDVFLEMQAMLDKTYRNVWTRDRRKTGRNDVPKGYELVHVIRNENATDWLGYWLKRLQVLHHCRDDPRSGYRDFKPFTADTALAKRHRLVPQCNEWLLFHGTNEAAARGIAAGDFTMRLAGTATGTLYGRGTYFAESITKCDEYAQADSDGVCTALICRVTGGIVNYNDEVTPDAQALTDSVTQGKYDSVVGDREKCRGTFKEYVLFDADQVYVEYILKYRRIY